MVPVHVTSIYIAVKPEKEIFKSEIAIDNR